MKPGKPDRFERVATEKIWTVHGITGVELVTREACAYLLRKEHAWMRRMVEGVRRWADNEIITKDDVTTVILVRLAQRRK